MKKLIRYKNLVYLLFVSLIVFTGCIASPNGTEPEGETAVAITISSTGQQTIPASSTPATTPLPPTNTPTLPTATPMPRATPSPFAPQMTEELTFKLLNQQGGAINSLAVVGQIAFVGVGPRLVIMDITNPTGPRILGQSNVLPGLVTAVLVRDGRAYVAAGASVITFDISDLQAPILLGQLLLSERVEHLALQDEALIAATAAGQTAAHEIRAGKLITIDVSQPEHPQLLDSVDLPWDIHAIALADEVVYVNHPADATFYALDISIPDNLPDPVPFPGAALTYSLLAQDQTLYLGGGRSDISAWDVSDLLQPQKLWEVLAEPDPDFGLGVVNGFVFTDNTVYLDTVSYHGQIIGPLALPLPEPMEKKSGDLVSSEISIQDDQLIITGLASLDLYTITGQEDVILQASYHIPSTFLGPRDIAVVSADKGLIVSQDEITENESSHLSLVQLPGLNLLGTYITEGQCEGCYSTWQQIAVDSNMAYISEDGNLYILDIGDPTQPTLVATYRPTDFGFFYELSVADEKGYAVGYATEFGNPGFLWELDLSDPQHVQAITEISWDAVPEQVAVGENALYLYATHYTDRQIYEVQRFTLEGDEPMLTGSLEVGSHVHDLALYADGVLVATTEGLIMVAEDPVTGQLMITTQLQIPGGLWELAIVDDVLLATTAESFGNGRLLAIDLQDLNQPRLIGEVSLPSGKAELAATDEGSILVGNAAMGLMVFEIDHTATSPNETSEASNQEAEETVDACVDTTARFNFSNAEKGQVRWRVDDMDNYHCCDHTNSVYQIIKNHDPASQLVLFSVRMDNNVPTKSLNAVVDLATGDFKNLGANYIDDPRYILTWLPDEEMVWIDDKGEIYRGSLETQAFLNAPAKMTDVWFVPPDRLLTRDQALQFYYFDLTNGVWTLLPAGESEKITIGWIDNAAVSDDGKYLFFFFENQSAILSNESGTIQIVSPFTSPDDYYVTPDGTEGDTFFPPQQIKGTPYWFFPTEYIFREYAGISYLSKSFIVDSRTGGVIEHEVLGIPPELAIYDSYLSPERMMVAVEVVEAIETLENDPPQVAQTWFISLSTGETWVEEGEFAGWETEDKAYLYAPLTCVEREIMIELAP